MRRCLAILMLPLAACGHKAGLPPIALLDLQPCPGWTGPRPLTDGQFARASGAEKAGRLCANAKLETVRAAVAASGLK